MPKLSTIDCRGWVHPGALTKVGGWESLACADSSAEWLRFCFSMNMFASPPLAFETSCAISRDFASGIHAWRRTVASVVDAPDRAFVLESRISESVPKALIFGPYSFAILVLVSSWFFDSVSRFASWRSIASLPSWGLRVDQSTVGRV